MRIPTLFVLTVFLALTGCSRVDREELELLKKDDPEFATMMQLKSGADHEIGSLKSRLSQTKQVFSQRKSDIENSYNLEAARIGGQIRVLETKVETLRDRLKAQIASLTAVVEAGKKQLGELDAALKDLNDVLARKGTLDMTSQDATEWEGRRQSLIERIAKLSSEISARESEIAVLRKKLKYI